MVIFQLNCLFTGGYVDWHPKIHIVHPKICSMWIYDDLCGFSVYHVFPSFVEMKSKFRGWRVKIFGIIWRLCGVQGVFALRVSGDHCYVMKKSKIQSGYFLWVHLGVGVYIEMVRYGGWKNPGFMIFHEVSSMIKGDDPGKTPALDDESWVVYRVGLPIWMLFFCAWFLDTKNWAGALLKSSKKIDTYRKYMEIWERTNGLESNLALHPN